MILLKRSKLLFLNLAYNGICSLFIKHTSASLVVQENYDPSVRQDFETIFSKLVPEDFPYVHNMEGKDDMPAHIRLSLIHI